MTTFFSRLEALTSTFLLKQSFFGLPWMIAGGVLPYFFNIPFSFSPWWWMTIAFLSARLSGMCFNRVLDRTIDAKNPRTQTRALPRGKVSWKEVFVYGLVFLFLFFMSSFAIGGPVWIFSPVAAFLFIGYSLTKRFTWLCHLILGLVQFLVPVFAAMATSGIFSALSLFLGLSVALLIAGNDILYACQDAEFDRRELLFSIPAHFGEEKARRIAKFLHIVCVATLLLFGYVLEFSWIYFLSIGAVCLVLLQSYNRLKKEPVDRVFAKSNAYVGLLVCLGVVGELWRATL